MISKANERAALLRDVRVASTGESFAEWCTRTVAEAPPPSDVQVMQLLGFFTQAADQPITVRVTDKDQAQIDDDVRSAA
ncbi:hypothetical protein [Arthrobacter sp. efr-133-TYG-118]|uniref:hypothetical protein n=1 Tax=Arthrobacter sp. efr-133-TYG-118 TaxID=3040279 RepID=UPI00255127BF|nr:hypothetical protein [Arthrobacter sp. efr-133-TYG-118]